MERETMSRNILEERLQMFFYLLGRDYLSSGAIEEILDLIGEVDLDAGEVDYSCDLSEALALRRARLLTEMSDNESGSHEKDRNEEEYEGKGRNLEGLEDIPEETGDVFRLEEIAEDSFYEFEDYVAEASGKRYEELDTADKLALSTLTVPVAELSASRVREEVFRYFQKQT